MKCMKTSIKLTSINKMKAMAFIKPICTAWAVLTLGVCVAQAPQGVSIKTTSSPPHASAMLEVESANKGLLMPRIALTSNTVQIGSVANADGLMVFNLNASLTTGTGTNMVNNGLQGRGLYYWDAMATPAQWVKQGASANSGAAFIPKMTFTQMGALTSTKTDADLGTLVFVTTTVNINFNSYAQVGNFGSAPNYTVIPDGPGVSGAYKVYNVYGLWYLSKIPDCGAYYPNTGLVWRYIGNTTLGKDLNQILAPPSGWSPVQVNCYVYPTEKTMKEDGRLVMVVEVPQEVKPVEGSELEKDVKGLNKETKLQR